jgi:hypothetical protein
MLQALQRASDSWRATIGSTAITVAISVFENSDDDFSDEDRQAFAQEQLDTLAFLYGDIESEVCMSFICFRRLITINLAISIPSSRTHGSSHFRCSLLCHSGGHQSPLSGRCEPAW